MSVKIKNLVKQLISLFKGADKQAPEIPVDRSAYRAWSVAQDRDCDWYTQRMFKPQINEWIPTLEFFKNDLNQEGKVVLEIGCGPTGGLLKFMNARLRIGIEPLANRFYERGFEKIGKPEILFLNSFGEKVPLVNEFSDIVCLIHSLGHIREPLIVLDETDRILKQGGMIFLFEIMRSPSQTTIDHPIALNVEVLTRWFEKKGYKRILRDTSKKTVEDGQTLDLFYGIYKKEMQPCTFSSVIDFSSDPYEQQIFGGWYQLETDSLPGRWVSDRFSAAVSVLNEHRFFSIKGYADLNNFPDNRLGLSLYIGDIKIGEYRFQRSGLFRLSFPLPEDVSEGKAIVKGECDQYFIPHEATGNGDDRELSLIIHQIGCVAEADI